MECIHDNLGHVETIEAYHQTTYEGDTVLFNNEYGGKIRDTVTCLTCRKQWNVNNSSPKFVKAFHEKVQNDRDTKM